MKRLAIILSLVVLSVLVSVVSSPKLFAFSASSTKQFVHVCPGKVAGYARCNAILVSNGKVSPNASSPSGYNPPDLQSAYKLPSSTAGSGQTVGIVDAYDDP
ncbi:MAG: peptidase S8, partial [Ktedonobacteraceae bacterium]